MVDNESPAPGDGVTPELSAAQRRLWFAYRMEPASAEFTVPWALRVRGALDTGALILAWRAVLADHGELRLRVTEHEGQPRRDSWPVERMPVGVRQIDPAVVDKELAAAAARQIDLAHEPLVELDVLRLAADDHVLLFTAHHIVVDGRSVQVLMRDLFRHYRGEAADTAAPDYRAYVAAEDATRPDDARVDRWLDQLRVPSPHRPLGFDPGDGGTGKRGKAVSVPVGPELWAAVRDLARTHRTTPHVVGMTALAVTLGRYTDTSDLVLGGTMDTRPTAFADTVGMFINPVPVRIRIADTQPVPELLATAHRALLTAFAHRQIPFEELVRRLNIAPSATRAPLFQVLFNYEPPVRHPEVPGLSVSGLEFPVEVSKYDLTMVLRHHGDRAELVGVYRADRYTEPQIRQLVTHVRRVLAGLVAADQTTVGALPLLDATETAALLDKGRGAELAADLPAVHTTVAAQVGRASDRIAVTCGDQQLSYREMDERAGVVAARLAAAGVGRGDRVAVLTDRSAAMVTAVLGVLRAGAAYLPLDPAYPAERIAAVLADARVSAVLVTEGLADQAAHPTVLRVDDDEALDRAAPDVSVDDTDPAYLIYTSGTTGEPKGVVVEHRQLAASTAARRAAYPGEPVFLLVSPLAFDSAAAGVWGTLTAGGQLVVAGGDDIRDPARLLDLIVRHRITDLLCVPGLYGLLLDAAQRTGAAALGSLRRVIVAGEALPEELLARHFTVAGHAELVNEYGPTETTVWASLRRYDRPAPVDIGGPIAGTRLYVTDARGRLAPDGVVGELSIGGAGVSRGYLGRPADTARVFGPDPYSGVAGARVYRTGDLVRWTATGTLAFLGRRDQQVKIRGYRVELGAVESALTAVDGVREAVVVPVGGTRLVGFVTVTGAFDPARTSGRMAELLPGPMVPSALHVLDAFPVTGNGKVDRAALVELAEAPQQATPAPASDDVAAQVAAAWSQVLGGAAVPLEANFFDVGGHSLLVPSLQAALQRHTGAQVSIVDLFSATTVAAQTALVRTAASASGGTRPTQPAEAAPEQADRRRARVLGARDRRVTGTDGDR